VNQKVLHRAWAFIIALTNVVYFENFSLTRCPGNLQENNQ